MLNNNALDIVKKGLLKAADKYIDAGRKELKAQGHSASGRLEKSFETKLVGSLEQIMSADIYFNDYGIYLDTGVRPQNVRYSIAHLISWAKIKHPSKSLQEIKSFLYATRTVHKREGIATKASRRFSSTGKRTGWIADSMKKVDKVEDFIDFDKAVQLLLNKIAESYGESSRT